jgi:hypothetical protein
MRPLEKVGEHDHEVDGWRGPIARKRSLACGTSPIESWWPAGTACPRCRPSREAPPAAPRRAGRARSRSPR